MALATHQPSGYTVITHFDPDINYFILSHKWLSKGEDTCQDININKFKIEIIPTFSNCKGLRLNVNNKDNGRIFKLLNIKQHKNIHESENKVSSAHIYVYISLYVHVYLY